MTRQLASELSSKIKAGVSRVGQEAAVQTSYLAHENRSARMGLKAALIIGVCVVGAGILIKPDAPETALVRGDVVATNVVPDIKYTNSSIMRHDFALETAQPVSRRLDVILKSGQSLGPLLQNAGLSGQDAYKVTQALSPVYKPRNLRAGQKFSLYFEQGILPTPEGVVEGDVFSALSFKPNVERTIFVTRKPDGDYASRDVSAHFEQDIVRISSEIESSLYLDALELGAPDRVIDQFTKIYQHGVDFQRDIRKGDSFEMTFIIQRDKRGNVIKSGDLLHTSFSPRGKAQDYYLFTDADGHENYYDENGKSAKRMLIRTPVSGARLSSRFGRRKHPVLGYRKLHKGVDFAAPRGTPIVAAGTGTVRRANRYGSFGNYVKIRHSDGYETAYAHLKSFARGVKSGRRVVQGQVIGYVGTTGRSTGPHLHYEVHKNGRAINPSTLSTLSGKPLKKSDMANFNARKSEIDSLRKSSKPVYSQDNGQDNGTDENSIQILTATVNP